MKERARVRRSMGISTLLVIATLGLEIGSADAQLAVYHSAADDGIDTGNSVPFDVSSHPLNIYITKGLVTSPSAVCEAGIGDELCAFTLDFATQGQFSFVDFTPEPGSNVTFNLTANRFRASGLDHLSPTPGPTRVGTLNINTPGLGGGVNMANSTAVSANLVLENFPDSAIAVPEPSLVFGLVAGLCFLTVVARRR